MKILEMNPTGVIPLLLLYSSLCLGAEKPQDSQSASKPKDETTETLKTAAQQRPAFNYNAIQNPYYAGQQGFGGFNSYPNPNTNYDVGNLIFPGTIGNTNQLFNGQYYPNRNIGQNPNFAQNPNLLNSLGNGGGTLYQGVLNPNSGGRQFTTSGFRPSQFVGFQNTNPFTGTTNSLLYPGQNDFGAQNGIYGNAHNGIYGNPQNGFYGNPNPYFGSVQVGSGIQVGNNRGNNAIAPSRGNTGFIANPYGRQHSYFDPNLTQDRNRGRATSGIVANRPSYSVLSGGIYSNNENNNNNNIHHRLNDRRPVINGFPGSISGFSSNRNPNFQDLYPLHNPGPLISGPSNGAFGRNDEKLDNNIGITRGDSLYYRRRRRPGDVIGRFPKSDEETL